jgi:Lrp/AsnC family leucine-responsive transcriptional regulator
MLSKVLDDKDRQILDLLAEDSRASLKSLAAAVDMSPPSVADRIRRLEETGVIRGFTVDINPAALGYTLEAIVRIRPLPGKLHVVDKLIRDIPELTECDKVTGDDCYIARLVVEDVSHIDRILDSIAELAMTSTSIVKAKTITRRAPPLG